LLVVSLAQVVFEVFFVYDFSCTRVKDEEPAAVDDSVDEVAGAGT